MFRNQVALFIMLSPNCQLKLQSFPLVFPRGNTVLTQLSFRSWCKALCCRIRFHLIHYFNPVCNTSGCWFRHILYLAPFFPICKSDRHIFSSKRIKKIELRVIVNILEQAQSNPLSRSHWSLRDTLGDGQSITKTPDWKVTKSTFYHVLHKI